METLVVAPHHRNHHRYYGSRNGYHDSKGSFRGISCRTFQYGAGLLPTPPRSNSISKAAFSVSLLPETSSPELNEHKRVPKSNAKSSSPVIPTKINFENAGKFHFFERWAGPAYSNSPPPSSLPLPKFMLRSKRMGSLDLPTLASEIDVHPIAKSAPASPVRGCSPSPIDLSEHPLAQDTFKPSGSGDLHERADSATKTLCRILNLDTTDE